MVQSALKARARPRQAALVWVHGKVQVVWAKGAGKGKGQLEEQEEGQGQEQGQSDSSEDYYPCTCREATTDEEQGEEQGEGQGAEQGEEQGEATTDEEQGKGQEQGLWLEKKMRLEKMMRVAKKKNHMSMQKQKGKQKQKAWFVHPGAPGPETMKAIRTAIRQAMTRQAMIAEECFHKAQSEITDSGSTIKPEYIGDGAISSADPQVVPTSSPFNDFNSEYYATIAAAAFNC